MPLSGEAEHYVERSPITHVDRFARPLLVLQGSEDEIVPPSQSEMIVAALREKGVPAAYLCFEASSTVSGAENIRRALDARAGLLRALRGEPTGGLDRV